MPSIQEYDRAIEYIELLLSAESDNRQALELKELIQKRMKKGRRELAQILAVPLSAYPPLMSTE